MRQERYIDLTSPKPSLSAPRVRESFLFVCNLRTGLSLQSSGGYVFHKWTLAFVTEGLGFARFCRARRRVGLQIAKYKLDSGKNHLGHLRSTKQQHRVTQSAVEDPPIAIASDPDEAIVVVGPDCEFLRRGARFGQVDAHEHVQLLPRVWSARGKMVQLVHVGYIVAFKLFGEWAVW